MPNWAATNYCLTGSRSELQEFADMINSLKGKPHIHENGFGDFWLGNLVALMGGDWEKVPCRGTIDPSPDGQAYLFGPEPDEDGKVTLRERDGVPYIEFSTETAWSALTGFEEFITERFPSTRIAAWRSTDEFGNFRDIHDPDGFMEDFCRLQVFFPDGKEVATDEPDDFNCEVLAWLGHDSDPEMTTDDVLGLIGEYNDSHDEWIQAEVWTEVNR